MKAKNFRRNMVSTMLVVAIVISIAIFALPTASAGGVISTPGGTTINVGSGQTFLLRHELFFSQGSWGGYFAMAISWDVPSSDENFTLENTPSVYWISGPESGLPVENVEPYDNSASLTGWKVGLNISAANKNYIDGHFNVDIWLRARGGDGTPHSTGNQQLSYGTGIAVFEQFPNIVPVDNVTIQVLGRGVGVTISPANQSGLPGGTLNYTVTVKNTGNMGDDNYILNIGDTAGWNPTLSGDNLKPDSRVENVPQGGNKTVTLGVNIPSGAILGMNDNIWVKAISQGDNTKSDNESCTAHVTNITFEASISPENQSGTPNEILTYIVTVKNTTDVLFFKDNYDLTIGDNSGWLLALIENRIDNVGSGENGTTTFTVTIPDNALPGAEDNITITATSQENGNVSDNATCVALVGGFGVKVSILPSENTALRGRTLTYTVTIQNTEGTADNFVLENRDELGWPMVLNNDHFDNVPPENTRTTTLHVTIPDNTAPSTEDNIRVIATSVGNALVTAESTCIAHLARVTFTVSISPNFQSRLRGENLTYTVTISNTTTDNVDFKDNYDLTISDNSGWPLSLLQNRIENVGRGENKNDNFKVTIPNNATPSTRDNVIITATSQADNRENRSGSCIAHSLAVHVSITPKYGGAAPEDNWGAVPGDNVTFSVKIWSTSTSLENDNFKLIVIDSSGWGPSVSPSENIGVSAVENGMATLTVKVPQSANIGATDNVTVTAISQVDNNVRDNASCIALAGYPGVSVSISPSYNENDRGENITYTVTVNNTGTIAYSFGLSVWDNVGIYENWNPSISPSSLTVKGGESENATLSVTVSWLSPPGTSDNITVRATSVENNKVLAENSCIAYSKLLVAQIAPTDDATVIDGSPNSNFEGTVPDPKGAGFRAPLVVGYVNYPGTIYTGVGRTFLKFNLPTLPTGSTIENVQLFLYRFTRGPGEDEPNLLCYRVENDNWYEGSITWNNQPSIENFLLDNVLGQLNQAWYSWDVTSFVVGEFGGDGKASFRMVTENIERRSYLFGSNETSVSSLALYRAPAPYLQITYRITPSAAFTTISPSYQSRLPGETISYQVMVKNMGWENRSYRLENLRDNLSWPKMLDDNHFDNVPPGENRTTTLHVTIPNNAVSCTRDNISVIVTSVEDNNLIVGSAGCVAHALAAYLSITPPPVASAVPGDNVTFAVNVWTTSTSLENDNFKLIASDNSGWGLSVLPSANIGVSAVENGMATLIVKVPENANIGSIDNITVTAISQVDDNVRDNASCIAQAGYMGLLVSISPKFQEVLPNAVSDKPIGYNVSITNTGTVLENFVLDNVIDNKNWTNRDNVSNNAFVNVFPGDVRTTALTVTIPPYADHGTTDNITVRWKATVPLGAIEYAADNCAVHVIRLKIELQSISPKLKSGVQGGNITWAIAIVNRGLDQDNYSLTVIDDAGWDNLGFDNNFFPNVPVNGERDTFLRIRIPDNAAAGMKDNLMVIVTSGTDPSIFENDNCSVLVLQTVGTTVTISPSENEGIPNENLTYTITVKNTGSIEDNYTLAIGDNSGWSLSLSDNMIDNVGPSENGKTTFTVTIPSNATGGTSDNIWVTATSKDNTSVFDNKSCLAQVIIVRGVQVVITPPSQENDNGGTVKFTVTVVNLGNVQENFQLTKVDNAGWTLALDNTWLLIPKIENRTTKLTVNIPSGAAAGTTDNIWVKATSKDNAAVFDNASCLAHVTIAGGVVRGVDVSISESSKSGKPGGTLDFTVTVKNTGEAVDTYDLKATDDAVPSWNPTLDENTLTIPAGENTTVTVSVTVPSDASEGDSTMITVTATSRGDSTKSDIATCTATATKAPPSRNLLPIVVVGVVVVGGAAAGAIALLVKKGAIHLG